MNIGALLTQRVSSDVEIGQVGERSQGTDVADLVATETESGQVGGMFEAGEVFNFTNLGASRLISNI